MKTLNAALAALLAFGLSSTGAAEVRVLSAGAVEPGLRPVLAEFEKATGHTITLGFAAAPQIRERGKAGAPFDLVIAPPGVLDELESAGKIDPDRAQRVSLGRVGVGVAVRPGATLPDISSRDAFARLMREADSVVFNRASTGLYVETLLRELGIDVQGRVTRFPDGASVMTHVLQSRHAGREIGLGATTEILLLRDKGLQFVGPLPPELQNFTTYVATLAITPVDREAAQALLRHLASAASKATFAAAGIDPAP